MLQSYDSYQKASSIWLLHIPTQWFESRIKYLATLQTEKATSKFNPIGLENVVSWTGRYVNSDSSFQGDGVRFKSGYILFGKLRPYLAKVLLTSTEGTAIGDFHVLSPVNDLNPRFLQYAMLTTEFIDVVDGSTYGAKMPRAGWDFLANIKMPVPESKEQKAIVTFLDRETARIDTLIEKQQRLIALLKEKCQAVVSHAVTKGLDPTVPMKDSGVEWLGEVPEHWIKKKLKNLFRFVKRQEYKDLPILSVYREFGVVLKSSRDDNNNRTPEVLSAYQLVKPDELVINKMRLFRKICG